MDTWTVTLGFIFLFYFWQIFLKFIYFHNLKKLVRQSKQKSNESIRYQNMLRLGPEVPLRTRILRLARFLNPNIILY